MSARSRRLDQLWKRHVGADVQRRLRQRASMSQQLLRDVVNRVPTAVTYESPFLLQGTARNDLLALIPAGGLEASRARAFLRLVRRTAENAYIDATYIFDLNQSDSSSDEDDEDYYRRRRLDGRRAGRSKRRSNRR